MHVAAAGFGLSVILARSTSAFLAVKYLADIAVVLAAVRLERRLKSSTAWQRRQRQVSGVALVGLGGYVAVS